MCYGAVGICLALLAGGAAPGESAPHVKVYGVRALYGEYEPSKFKEWSSIPEPARSRIITHLKKRLGESFYSQLSLAGGEHVDLNILREKEPEYKTNRREVPAYHLWLRFSRRELGIDFYEATLTCRSDGSVITEIDLPEITKHPERAKFISTSEAVAIARRNGFDVSKAVMRMEYRRESGVCVFVFEQQSRKEDEIIQLKCLDIDAHDGKVHKTYELHGFE